ncbi:MAG TPA: inactive serine/threonine-protein kinase VRK3 [Myxococcaceae bacterium]|nr:inactive serine/threonine-protein kinase VRK3 [Myxococcaceae bacterium]
MREQLLRCPNCNAPLAPPSRFASSMDCGHCGAHVKLVEEFVPAAPYLEALAQWNAPPTERSAVSMGGTHWFVGERLARGAHSDVHVAARARHPTQLAVLHLSRDARGDEAVRRAATTLRGLRRPRRLNQALIADRTPTVLFDGTVPAGRSEGRQAMVCVWRHSFRFTLHDVRERLERPLHAHQAIWIFRRLCEVLGALHRAGLSHGAVYPEHVLVEDGEHGARLLGFGSAGPIGDRLPTRSEQADAFGLDAMAPNGELGPGLDLGLAARTIIWGLGGSPRSCTVPSEVPAPLADFLQRISRGASMDAVSLRDQAGRLGEALFGRPRFAPLVTAEDPA